MYFHLLLIMVTRRSIANADASREYVATAIVAASNHGYETIVRMLLDRGADVKILGGRYNTALQAASESGHETIVRLLLDHGADVDNLLDSPSAPLHAALRWGYVEVVSLLLEYGADMDASSVYYSNALMAAEACGNEQKRAVCKQILLDEKRKRQPEPYLVWVDGIAYLNCQ
ncbi:hypothetical protein D6D11_04783 [Aureobasidium pullulans]|nr:hypothetical protein D6D11_04783 [Aureobasidium pullulans]